MIQIMITLCDFQGARAPRTRGAVRVADRSAPWKPDAARRDVVRFDDGFGRRTLKKKKNRFVLIEENLNVLPRKEVIQPHLPVRLPCYDFTPLTLHTFGASPLAVGPATSGADDSGGVTGGVYKARERIHRGMLIRDY